LSSVGGSSSHSVVFKAPAILLWVCLVPLSAGELEMCVGSCTELGFPSSCCLLSGILPIHSLTCTSPEHEVSYRVLVSVPTAPLCRSGTGAKPGAQKEKKLGNCSNLFYKFGLLSWSPVFVYFSEPSGSSFLYFTRVFHCSQ